MKISKEARRVSRSLFRACVVDGKLNEDRVRIAVTQVASAKPRGYIAILQSLKNLVANDLAGSVAIVESATELDGATKSELQTGLNNKYGRSLALTFQVTPDLLGGIRVKVGSDVWDGSVKARLAALQVALS